MHSDVLELFIIASSVPVLHLSQEKDSNTSDTVLKAGRISAQDMLGEETTGELIQREVLTESTITYGRENDILVALRVANSMSTSGVNALLADVLLQVDKYKDLIWNSFGDAKILRPLIKRLHLTLGAKLPTNPYSMAQINILMENYFEKLPYIDQIGIVTQESWLVNVSSREDRRIGPVSGDIWKNAVELLHGRLGKENLGLVVTDEESIFWLRPIFFKNLQTRTGRSWWALVVQISVRKLCSESGEGELPTILPSHYARIIEDLDLDFYPSIEPLIREMVENELRRMGRSGVLAQLLSYVEYTFPNARTIQLTREPVPSLFIEGTEVPWETFLEFYKNQFLFHHPDSIPILDQEETVMLSIHEAELDLLVQRVIDISRGLDTHSKLHIGMGSSGEFNGVINYFNQVGPVDHKIFFYTEDTLEDLEAPENLVLIDHIDTDAQISEYKFVVLENPATSLALVFFKETGTLYSGIWTHSRDVIDLIMSRISGLTDMIHS